MELALKNQSCTFINGAKSILGIKNNKHILLIGTTHEKEFISNIKKFLIGLREKINYKILLEFPVDEEEKKRIRLKDGTSKIDYIIDDVSDFEYYIDFDFESISISNQHELLIFLTILNNLENIEHMFLENPREKKDIINFLFNVTPILENSIYNFTTVKKDIIMFKKINKSRRIEDFKFYFPEYSIIINLILTIEDKTLRTKFHEIVISMYKESFDKINIILDKLTKEECEVLDNLETFKKFLLKIPKIENIRKLIKILTFLCDIRITIIGALFQDIYTIIKIINIEKDIVFVAGNAHIKNIKNILTKLNYKYFNTYLKTY